MRSHTALSFTHVCLWTPSSSWHVLTPIQECRQLGTVRLDVSQDVDFSIKAICFYSRREGVRVVVPVHSVDLLLSTTYTTSSMAASEQNKRVLVHQVTRKAVRLVS